MQRKSDELAVQIDGYNGRLYRRDGSQNYWLKVKLPDGRWDRRSTGAHDLAEARANAIEALIELRVKARHNISPRATKFFKVAEATLDDLRAEAALRGATGTPKSYVYAIERHLIPFFGEFHIDRLDRALLAKFDDWRAECMGHKPKKSTVQTHNAALHRIFQTALRNGWIKDWQVPILENSGVEGDTRATFTQAEFDQLASFMETWVPRGRGGLSYQIRFALRELVLTIAATGMRPGTETEGLVWSDIEEAYKHADGETYLRFWLTEGKTEKREIIVPSKVQASLDRLRDFNPNWKPSWPIFASWDGRYPDFCRPFQRLLNDADLVRDRHGEKRTLYSLRHFYATRQRERGVSFEVLSKQMGTSYAMLEKHYVHVTPTADARVLAGLPDPQLALIHDFIADQREQEARRTLQLSPQEGAPLAVTPHGVTIKAA